MTRWLISLLLQRILLPFALLAGVAVRQNGLSGIYLLLLLIVPFIPVPTSKTMSGHAGRYQKSVITLTILNIISILAFQFVLIAYPPYGRLVKPQGSSLEKYLRYAGLVRLDGLDWLNYLQILLPEVLVLVAAVITYVVSLRLNPASLEDQLLPVSGPPLSQPSQTEGDKAAAQRKLSLLTSFGKYICLISLCFAGTLRPSVLSGIYFLVFLGSMTWWGLNKTLGKPFAWTCRCLLFVLVGHIVALFLYQMEWAQQLLPSDHPIARYLGLSALLMTDTVDHRKITISSLEWDSFVNPLALIWLYFIIIYESNMIINAPDYINLVNGFDEVAIGGFVGEETELRGGVPRYAAEEQKKDSSRPVDDETTSPVALTEATPLIRGRESLYRRGTSRRGLIQDSMGSVTITEVPEETIKEEATPEDNTRKTGGTGENIPLKEFNGNKRSISRTTETGPGVLEIALNAGITISQLLAQSSYIATNIIMMAWSITYHSWLTFILLLWASIMWLMPNQRKAMLRSSPFLVFYATCLLLIQYVYGMNLTNDELPQIIQGVNLKQIGLEKILHFPVKPLIIKILFTVMFWITLKQYNQEKWEARNQSALADIAAPLQIGVGTATGIAGESQTRTSQLVKQFGTLCRSLLTKFWIWIVASILFTIGISGDRVTIFRIIYMALALIFILTFQLSWTFWRKMMYGFWLVLILYSMLILVMTYTYQFDNFDTYWEQYLHTPKKLQEDIGLERYETTELFVKLLTPTFFVVITVIQLYYFHNDFLAISDIKSRGSSIRPRISDVSNLHLARSDRSSSAGPEIITPVDKNGDSDTIPEKSREKIDLRKAITEIRVKEFTMLIVKQIQIIIELIWLFLELHMLKFVMIALMILSVYDVCVLHIAFVALVVVGIMFGTRIQTLVVHTSSFLISILFLSKMIYQINYINHNDWNVTCPGDNETYNTAEWIGYFKVDDTTSLPMLLRSYIIVILAITFHSVIIRRQKYQRHLRGRQLSRPFIMFPRINYRDVDTDLTSCIKYLFNYGFYRFGVEICLIAIVSLIGLRMDFYAVLYALWLCLLITPNRRVLSSIWPFFTLFIVVTIPFQYALAVGFPPSICFVYPWDQSETLERMQEWMFFPDAQHPPPAYKLLCDFIVLLLVCRQGIVFRIEKRHRNMDFPGGTNKSIIHQFEEPNFTNPTPDFISFTRSWLDIAKRVVITGFIWVTLAIVFLAGTNRVNVFSLGYLIGAFIFLWQGNDFYLRPIRSILKWWNFLIGYNVSVILIKALLQILGCIYIKEMQVHACWAVQILGIACIKKFSPILKETFDPVDCTVPRGEVGLAWDGCCFIFLILQRRLFNSYYFFHIVDETKAMTVLASRGAELIEDLARRQIMEQQESEKKILEKIKNKMDRIKASQKRIQGPNFPEPTSHYVEDGAPLAHDSTPSISSPASPQGFHTPVEDDVPRLGGSLLQAPTPTSAILSRSLDGYLEPQRMSFGSPPASELHRAPSLDDSFPVFSPPPYGAVVMRHGSHRGNRCSIGPPWLGPLATPRQSIVSNTSPKSHHTSIRSGDYYMFEDVEEEVDLLLDEESSESSTELSDEAIDQRRSNVVQLLSTALKTDLRKAAEKAMEQNREADETVRRGRISRDSEPLRRRRNLSLMLPPSSERERWRRSATSLQETTEIQPIAGPSGIPLREDRGDEERDGESGKDDERTKEVEKKDDDGDDDVPEGPPWKEKMITFLKFLWAFIDSLMVSITTTLNRFSRDYRYVMRTLTVEKKQLKTSKDFGIGLRPSPGHIWQPLPLAELSKPKSSDLLSGPIDEVSPEELTSDFKDTRSHQDSNESTLDSKFASLQDSNESTLDSKFASPVSIGEFEEQGELTASEQPPLFRLVLAIWFAILSHSELVCYFTIFLHQIRSPTILSLPLPLMVFLWATLTVPRPSKNFWVTIIAYTEVVVVVKCMFQFEILPWNQKLIPDNAPFALPRIIGIERQPGMYAYYDLLLLLVVFFHRSMLKSLGLWKATVNNVPVKSNKDSPSSETTELSGSENTQASKKDNNSSKDNTVKDLVVIGETNQSTQREYFPPLPLKGNQLCQPCHKFFGTLLESKGRVTTDVYAYMFFCDFFNFLVVIFGFAAFGSQQGDGGVSQYFEENKVPIAFLVMLILQFGLIIIDRTLYLRKFILGKIIFQFVLVIGIHVWMFFVLPAVTDRQFNAALPPQMWYMVKCFYLLLSAYQIRCGYPSRIFGNFLCKSYNYINMFLFKVFMAVPFVFELRALMDWIWTDTSMTLSDWLKMEDIFAHVFQLKCQRRAEKDYPQPRGEKKNTFIKYIVGGGCLIGIIAVIWFPLVLFALGNTVGQPNIPTEVALSLRIGAYTPIYQYTAQNYSIYSLKEEMWEDMLNVYKKSRAAQTFLSNYEYDDVGVAILGSHSTVVWTISPPDKETLIKDLMSNRSMSVRMEWSISRKSTSPEQPGLVTNSIEQPLSPSDPNREIIAKYVMGNKTEELAVLPHLLPKFLKVTSRGTANVINQLMIFDDDAHADNPYRPLTARLIGLDQPWWEVKEKCGDPVYENYLSKLHYINCQRLVMYTFNDKAFPATLNIISGKGIIGLYTTFVIVIHSVIRGFFTGISFKIMFDDMPNVDRLLQLCLDIYLVRESGELDLEEDLFAKLVFLYRSPETLIKWTRPPEEIGDDEADAQPELNS